MITDDFNAELKIMLSHVKDGNCSTIFFVDNLIEHINNVKKPIIGFYVGLLMFEILLDTLKNNVFFTNCSTSNKIINFKYRNFEIISSKKMFGFGVIVSIE